MDMQPSAIPAPPSTTLVQIFYSEEQASKGQPYIIDRSTTKWVKDLTAEERASLQIDEYALYKIANSEKNLAKRDVFLREARTNAIKNQNANILNLLMGSARDKSKPEYTDLRRETQTAATESRNHVVLAELARSEKNNVLRLTLLREARAAAIENLDESILITLSRFSEGAPRTDLLREARAVILAQGLDARRFKEFGLSELDWHLAGEQEG
jgi:hypothetical protein